MWEPVEPVESALRVALELVVKEGVEEALAKLAEWVTESPPRAIPAPRCSLALEFLASGIAEPRCRGAGWRFSGPPFPLVVWPG